MGRKRTPSKPPNTFDRAMAKIYIRNRNKPEILLRAEQALFAAIIEQAIKDVFKEVPIRAKPDIKMRMYNNKISAAKFLFDKSGDWAEHRKLVFFYAGLDEDISLEHLRRKYLGMS